MKLKKFTTNEVKKILKYSKENDVQMYYIELLSILGSLRPSEILSLKSSSVHDNSVIVHRIKTNDDFMVCLPDFLIDYIKNNSIVLSSDELKNRFQLILKQCEISHIPFHSLRTYSIEILSNLPSDYLSKRFGFSKLPYAEQNNYDVIAYQKLIEVLNLEEGE